MKFETKMAKLNIDENEVKSIIGACECGEVNGAYFLDLSKMRRWEIFETIGNYFNMEERNDYVEETDWTDIKRMSTFCKTFGIEESEIPSYYVVGFNEGGCDIAYTLESNEDVILVLTDDERYTNSFIKYSPSQQEAEEPASEPVRPVEKIVNGKQVINADDYTFEIRMMGNQEMYGLYLNHEWFSSERLLCSYYSPSECRNFIFENFIGEKGTKFNIIFKEEDNSSSSENIEAELEQVTAQYDAKLEELTQLDSEVDVYEICTDKVLMAEYESQKEQIEKEISEIEDKIEEINEKMEAQTMTEEIVAFKIESKSDDIIFLEGSWDISTYDEDTDDGDWEYQQNDGTYQAHLPSYWKVDGENLSEEYDRFLQSIDWEMFRQWLMDFRNESKTTDCGEYILHINPAGDDA